MAVDNQQLSQVVMMLSEQIDEQTDEAILRAYINRSYYVIYHECKNHLETYHTQYNLSDSGTFKTGTHNRIYLSFEEIGKQHKIAYKIALKFKDFLNKRHQADYRLTDTVNYMDYKQCQGHFETIPRLLNELI